MRWGRLPTNVPAAKELGSGSCHTAQVAIAREVAVDPATPTFHGYGVVTRRLR
jgi:hypothetical protein